MVYILSQGSQQGNKNVHRHIAPLPFGVPFEQQQLEAPRMKDGILQLSAEEVSALAARCARRLAQPPMNNPWHP